VVSHDRHFLDTICTHIADIDFQKLKIFTGNYSFWYESSQLALRQKQAANKKAEDRKKELQEFIARFSANASKSKQATSRKKLLDKINVDEIQASSRRYPAIIFNQSREAGDQILHIEGLSASLDGKPLFSNVDLNVTKGDKITLISKNSLAIDQLFKILNNEAEADSGIFYFGQTMTTAYLPADNGKFFDTKDNLIDWLKQFSEIKDDVYVRGFLGKMLFTGEETFKSANVLSGGEKVRCMISRMMLAEANFLMINEPTAHLDLESIQAFNNSLIDFKGTLMFASHDHTFTNSVADRVVEIGPKGMINKQMTYDEYMASEKVQAERLKIY
jgi:ATPase subunit of ABC transporter with duplicated ATPase domains